MTPMAGNIYPHRASHGPHERHMAELMFAALALIIVIVVGGVYLYATNHQQYHCPTVTVATARC